MLTGEYVVLDGATALAIPTKFGQFLEVISSENDGIRWMSITKNDEIWYQGQFNLNDGMPEISTHKDPISEQLLRILVTAKQLNPQFLKDSVGYDITTKLNFPRDWGLGTSSTLLNNIAQWAQIDAFKLLKESFGGSGYDVAAAQADTPILYTLINQKPSVRISKLDWNFKEYLFFVHLNKKQDSKDGISRYKKASVSTEQIAQINTITQKIVHCKSLDEFSELIREHEDIVSSIIGMPTVKAQLFSDYEFPTKSLGAWGGDFILAVGGEKELEYFKNKGYKTIISFTEMIK